MAVLSPKRRVTRAISPLGRRSQQPRRASASKQSPNYVAGLLSLVWLVIVMVPVYVLVKSSFQTQSQFSSAGPLALPHQLSVHQYSQVIHDGFLRFFLNTAIVTVASVLIVLALVPPTAFAIVRNQSRIVGLVFRILLLGLAVPIAAVIVPMFYMMQKVHLYDTLLAVILPTAAFSIPICTVILTGSMRDITPDLYEAMALDGASSWRVFRHLVLPLSRGGLATITVFAALQAWNGFLFPLVLTQSDSSKVFTLGLYDFQTANGVDVPAIAAAVVLSIVPILLVYLFARRWLIQGLMGVGGK